MGNELPQQLVRLQGDEEQHSGVRRRVYEPPSYGKVGPGILAFKWRSIGATVDGARVGCRQGAS
jgi:hypothetical protein